MAAVEVPQTLEYRGGQLIAALVLEDFQDSPDDEEDTRSSHEYLNDLEEEYQVRALLAKFSSKRVLKGSTVQKQLTELNATNMARKVILQETVGQRLQNTKDEAKYHKVKAKLALLSSSALAPGSSSCKNKGLIAKTYDWDDEEVLSDENEVTEVKALMALTDEERVSVGKESARNGDLTNISMKKNKENNLLSKYRNLVQELNTCKEHLLVLKQAKLDLLTMQHVNTEILKENQNLKFKLKELTSTTETWLNSSNIVNQCINEQIPTQKKKIIGSDQLTEDTSSFESKELVFVKSSVDNLDMPITNSNIHKLSETEDFTLPNQDIDEVPSNESQRNITNPSVSDSSATDYDSANESSVCSTPLLPLKKLDGDESVSGPKTIKSILKSKSTFKVETLKGITINEPSSAPHVAKVLSFLRTNSAPADISLEENSIQKSQHVKKNCKTCGSNVHTTADHNDIEWFRKRETLQAKNAESFKASKNESSSASRSKTPTKSAQTAVHRAHYLAHSGEYVAPPSIDVVRQWFLTIGYGEEVLAKGGKTGGFDQITNKDAIILYSLANGINIDYENIFWEDIILKLKKKQREKSASGNDASAVSTAKADPRNSTPRKGASSIARQVKEEASRTIKLEDLAKLVSNVQPSFKDLDSPEDDPVIIIESDAEEDDGIHATDNVETKDTSHKLELEKNKAEAEVALLKAQPSFPNMEQLKELLEFLSLPGQVASVQAKLKTLYALPGLLSHVTKALNKFAQVLDSASSKAGDQSVSSAGQADTMPAEGEKNTNQATISQLFQRRAKKIKAKRLSSEEAEKESTESGSDDETTHMPGSTVESSKKKELKKFDFITESREHVHLTKEQIRAQKEIEKEPKAEAARHEGEIRKEELIDLLGLEVVNKYYNDKLQYDKYCDKMLNGIAASRITKCDVLTRKGLITLKVYREDGTSKIIPNFKAIDPHLGQWREDPLDNANKKRKHVDDIYDYFKVNKKLKSSVQYEDHLPGTVLNEPVLGLDDHARTFSSLLLDEIDKRNLNPPKQMRVIEQLRQ
ncbi:hypothetical protein Tco_0856775 [Tanacetum coccineum]|uniref:Uncharacterized protein n=1 Tax=Tanacetum coccineum TaxID=301880 RepID=A0ABQ5B7C8_9ASTR